MEQMENVDVLFVAGFGPITGETTVSSGFYRDLLALPLKPMDGNPDYMATGLDALEGVKHFALWPLSQAAQSCFGTDTWPDVLPVPQAWLEFEVADLEAATATLVDKGCHLLIANRMEPWGQSVTRLLSPEGLLVGITVTPWLRQE